MKALYLILALSLSLCCTNVFASNIHTNNNSKMCVYAYLAKPIRDEEVVFYDDNCFIGITSVYGRWIDVVGVYVGNYFKDHDEFERKKKFLRLEKKGKKVAVNRFTYEPCI